MSASTKCIKTQHLHPSTKLFLKKLFQMVACGWIFVATGSHSQTGKDAVSSLTRLICINLCNWLIIIIWTRFWKTWTGRESKSIRPGPPGFPLQQGQSPGLGEVCERKSQTFPIYLNNNLTCSSIIYC